MIERLIGCIPEKTDVLAAEGVFDATLRLSTRANKVFVKRGIQTARHFVKNECGERVLAGLHELFRSPNKTGRICVAECILTLVESANEDVMNARFDSITILTIGFLSDAAVEVREIGKNIFFAFRDNFPMLLEQLEDKLPNSALKTVGICGNGNQPASKKKFSSFGEFLRSPEVLARKKIMREMMEMQSTSLLDNFSGDNVKRESGTNNKMFYLDSIKLLQTTQSQGKSSEQQRITDSSKKSFDFASIKELISNENQHGKNSFFERIKHSKQSQKVNSNEKEAASKDLPSIKSSPFFSNPQLFKSNKNSTQSAFNHKILAERNANSSKSQHSLSQSTNSLFNTFTPKHGNSIKEQSKCAISIETIKELERTSSKSQVSSAIRSANTKENGSIYNVDFLKRPYSQSDAKLPHHVPSIGEALKISLQKDFDFPSIVRSLQEPKDWEKKSNACTKIIQLFQSTSIDIISNDSNHTPHSLNRPIPNALQNNQNNADTNSSSLQFSLPSKSSSLVLTEQQKSRLASLLIDLFSDLHFRVVSCALEVFFVLAGSVNYLHFINEETFEQIVIKLVQIQTNPAFKLKQSLLEMSKKCLSLTLRIFSSADKFVQSLFSLLWHPEISLNQKSRFLLFSSIYDHFEERILTVDASSMHSSIDEADISVDQTQSVKNIDSAFDPNKILFHQLRQILPKLDKLLGEDNGKLHELCRKLVQLIFDFDERLLDNFKFRNITPITNPLSRKNSKETVFSQDTLNPFVNDVELSVASKSTKESLLSAEMDKSEQNIFSIDSTSNVNNLLTDMQSNGSYELENQNNFNTPSRTNNKNCGILDEKALRIDFENFSPFKPKVSNDTKSLSGFKQIDDEISFKIAAQ